MGGSWRIATLSGIGVYMHWTFLLLVGWVLASHLMAGQGLLMSMIGVALVLALFGCVVLHEMGHALMARRYGIGTKDITLLPIGGLARLGRIPENPMQELMIAIAGPAVNVVIAAVLAVVLAVMGEVPWESQLTLVGGTFLTNLLVVNVILVIFNLLPAFPMDGGRVLRALLAMRLPYARATRIAVRVGQAMAILFAIVGITGGNFMLALIALFIFAGGQAEANQAQLKDAVRGLPVRVAMTSSFHTLPRHATVATAGQFVMQGYQGDFVIESNGELAGILRHGDVTKAILADEVDRPVAELMTTDCPTVAENEPLSQAMEKMASEGCESVVVLRQGHIIGMLSLARLGEWIALHSALGKPRPGSSTPPYMPPSYKSGRFVAGSR